MKSLRIFFLLAAAVCAVAAQGKADKLLPSWFGSAASLGKWVGVSAPIADQQAARQMAIGNALSYYLLSTGDVKAKLLCSLDFSSENADEKNVAICSRTLFFTDFSLDVEDEFYNERGECFVACRISRSAGAPDRFAAHTELEFENGTGHISTEYYLKHGEEEFEMQSIISYLAGLYDEAKVLSGTSSFDCGFESKYKKAVLASEYSGMLCEAPLDKPLGLALQELFATMPTFTHLMDVNNATVFNDTDINVQFLSNSSSTLLPSYLKLLQIGDKLSYSYGECVIEIDPDINQMAYCGLYDYFKPQFVATSFNLMQTFCNIASVNLKNSPKKVEEYFEPSDSESANSSFSSSSFTISSIFAITFKDGPVVKIFPCIRADIEDKGYNIIW